MQKKRGQRNQSKVRADGPGRLPAVSELLEHRRGRRLRRVFGPDWARESLRTVLDERRRRLRGDGRIDPSELKPTTILAAAEAWAQRQAEPQPKPLLNATGVIVHTNLGRSVLSEAAAKRVAASLSHYVDLEYDVEAGGRGDRMAPLRPLMELLFPGYDFHVVNNNAAATMLALHALCRGKEAIVSRGELVEIGGSFRVPDIMRLSGARLVEVGTTNRSRRGDYAAAIGKRTGLLMKVHTSNFRIVGFAAEVGVASLSALAAKHEIPLLVDWGSGDLVDLQDVGIRDETPIAEILKAGADLVTFSGDKLLGGPQAGFLVGRPEVIAKVKKDPLARVCRLDRILISALHETLLAYASGRAWDEVPTLRMMKLKATAIGRRARTIADSLKDRIDPSYRLAVVSGVSRTGGGSSPRGEIGTRLLRVSVDGRDCGELQGRLRDGTPPVIGRVHDGSLLLDLRTVPAESDDQIGRRLGEVLSQPLARR
ncbi:MAG: L-seryl-tRNA(Sec) selenium transferase [Acidobacteriota bacterium]|nr:L-seryl-tRNA(Sec) selenium transferase [Acidobacteriota bacterium]MDH3785150.1 L-seryl-tRNA(Sec) selenium transferase [Acidobacteriota bacterium]